MENERKRILKLVENGTISAEEAIILLEALSKKQDSTTKTAPSENHTIETKTSGPFEENQNSSESEQSKNTKSKSINFEDFFGKAFNNKESNKKMDDFVSGLKQDFSQLSQRMMGLMNSTFEKIKDIDLEFPFGEKIEISKNYVFDVEDIKGIELDIPNGKVEVEKTEGNQVLLEATIKTSTLNQDEEQAKEQFEENFITLVNGKLTIATTMKLSQVSLCIKIPEKQYDIIIMRLLNGTITIQNLDTKLLKLKTYNGAIKINHSSFVNGNIETGNGPIDLRDIQGEDLEIETVNGRIYIDGKLKEVEAESVNGAVVITTSDKNARKVKAQTVAGAVEIYLPKSLSLDGQVTTNFGKADVGLPDIATKIEDDQFLLKTLHFDKIIEDAPMLKITGESRTGSIIIRYIAE